MTQQNIMAGLSIPATPEAVALKFGKLLASMRMFLRTAAKGNPEYWKTLAALELAYEYDKPRMRKDNITPYFMHQLRAMHYLLTVGDSVMNLPVTLGVMALHDTPEDHPVSYEMIVQRTGSMEMAEGAFRMNKYTSFKGDALRVQKTKEQYFSDLSSCPHCSVCKGVDRNDNYSTMSGVFSVEKQRTYLEEGVDFYLPLMKEARRRFPQQYAVYENLKFIMENQMNLIYQGLPK